MAINKNFNPIKNGTIRITGNALLYNNSVYSINNILSLTFNSVTQIRDKPEVIQNSKNRMILYFKMATVVLVILLISLFIITNLQNNNENIFTDYGINEVIVKYIAQISIIFISFILFFYFLTLVNLVLWIVTLLYYNSNKKYTISGLEIKFITNYSLFFITKNSQDEIKKVVDEIYKVISLGSNYRKEIKINFTDRSIKVDKLENSNLVGGDMRGNINN